MKYICIAQLIWAPGFGPAGSRIVSVRRPWTNKCDSCAGPASASSCTQDGFGSRNPERGRVELAMEEDEAFNPVEISLLAACALVLDHDALVGRNRVAEQAMRGPIEA